MSKTATFSFKSETFEGVEAKETFTFEKLGINENLDDEALKMEIERIFKAWVSDKLNLSFSIVHSLSNK